MYMQQQWQHTFASPKYCRALLPALFVPCGAVQQLCESQSDLSTAIFLRMQYLSKDSICLHAVVRCIRLLTGQERSLHCMAVVVCTCPVWVGMVGRWRWDLLCLDCEIWTVALQLALFGLGCIVVAVCLSASAHLGVTPWCCSAGF
jgi:hypothetical protein